MTDVITLTEINFDEEEMLARGEDKERLYLEVVLPAKLERELLYCQSVGFCEDQRVVLQTVAGVARRILGSLGVSHQCSEQIGVEREKSAAVTLAAPAQGKTSCDQHSSSRL